MAMTIPLMVTEGGIFIHTMVVGERGARMSSLDGVAMIDSGADFGAIPQRDAEALGWKAVRTGNWSYLGSVKGDAHQRQEYLADVHIGIDGTWVPVKGLSFCGVPDIERASMVLGRDFLRQFVFTYDGPAQTATLIYREPLN